MSLKYEILSLLEKLGEATTKEISKQLNIDVSVVKVYMNRLHKAGLVERRKAGMEYVYRLASPSPTPLPPPTTSSTPTSNRVNMKVNNRVNMKVNNRESLYNVNLDKVNNRVNMKVNMPVNIRKSLYNVNSSKVNMKVNIAKNEVNNKYNVNLDSSLYFLYYIKDELKKLIEQIEFYVNSDVNPNVNRHVNPDVNWHVNPNVNSDVNPRVVVEEEVVEGSRGVSPPGAGVGREWAYTLLALLSTRKLAQHLLAQNNDPLSIAILERLLTHYFITSNKFILFSDYRELIEYFNLNVNDIIKSKQTLNKAITKLYSHGLIYFVKISGILKLGLKKKALKVITNNGPHCF